MNDHFSKFAGAYIRGVLYAAVAFLTSFIAEFETMPAATIAGLTIVGWAVAWAKVLLPTAVTMRAFFDGTLERIAQADSIPSASPGPAGSPPAAPDAKPAGFGPFDRLRASDPAPHQPAPSASTPLTSATPVVKAP